MAYTKYSLTPANNTATPPDGAPEGMLPSAVNDTMRDMMAQIRDCGDGIRDGTYTMTAAKITGGTITGVTFTGNTFSNPTITGVSTFAAGTVSAPALTTTGDTNTGIFFPAADTIAFTEGGAEAMRIDSSGNVGVGVTPNTWGSAYKAIQLTDGVVLCEGGGNTYIGNNWFNDGTNKYIATGAAALYEQSGGVHAWYTAASGTGGTAVTFTERMRISSAGNVGIGMSSPTYKLDILGVNAGADSQLINIENTGSGASTAATIRFRVNTSSVVGLISYVSTTNNNDGAFTFSTTAGSTAERMRITSAGNVLINATSVGLENGGIQFQPNGNATNVPFIGCAGNSSSSSYISYGLYSTSLSQYQFYVDYNGTISARSTSITGLSDISEKENIKPLETGLNEVLALQPRRFDWKNGSGKNIAGFVAQEVETVLPDLVADYKVNIDTTKKGLKMGDMIPTLVKAIQEQQAMIEELKAKVTALENK